MGAGGAAAVPVLPHPGMGGIGVGIAGAGVAVGGAGAIIGGAGAAAPCCD